MPPSAGNDSNVVFERRRLVFAAFSLLIAIALTVLAKGGVSIVGLAGVACISLLIYFLYSVDHLEKTVILVFQVLLGAQILPVIQYEKTPALMLGAFLMIFTPSILWLGYVKWGIISLLDSIGCILILSGFLLSWLSPIQIGGVGFSLSESDITLALIVITSIVLSSLLAGRVFSETLILATLAVCFSTITYLVFLTDFIESEYDILNHRVGLYTALGPNLFAFCLDMSVPLNIGFSFFCKKRKLRYLLFLNSVIQLGFLILTGTRGSIVSILAVLIWIALYFRKHKYFFLVVIPLGSIVVALLIQKAIGRLLLKSETELISTLGRIYLLKSAWNVLEENSYIWGIGVDRFSLVKFDFGFPLWFNPTKSMSSHNTYLEYWLGWGGLALLGYILTIAFAVLKLFRNATNINVGVGVAIIGYSVHGFVDSSVANFPITFAFWLLLGVGISKNRNSEKSKK